MMAYALRLTEDRFAGDASSTLAPLNRVLYVLSGEIIVTSEAAHPHVPAGTAWHGGTACAVRAGVHGATVLRYELLREAPASPGVSRVTRAGMKRGWRAVRIMRAGSRIMASAVVAANSSGSLKRELSKPRATPTSIGSGLPLS